MGDRGSRNNHPATPHHMVQLVAKVETQDGPLKGRVTVYSGPTHLAELIPSLQALTDGLVGLTLNRARKEGRQISCKAGCGACCRLMVALSVPELFYLQDLVASLPPERRKAVLQRFEHIVAELEGQGLYSRLQQSDYTDESNLQLAREYFHLGLPCPFLENASCMVYPARPLACREYHVTTPVEWCAVPYSQPIQTLKLPVAMPVALAHLSADLLGVPAKLIPLSLAIRWTAENAAIHQQTWPGPWLFKQFLAQFNSLSTR